MAQSAAAARPHASAVSVKQGSGSRPLAVADRALAGGGAVDNYDILRRRMLADPHYREALGVLPRMPPFDDWAHPWYHRRTAHPCEPLPWLLPFPALPLPLPVAPNTISEISPTADDMITTIDFLPRMDVLYYDSPFQMVVIADLPGVVKEDVHVYVEDGALVIKGQSSKDHLEVHGPHRGVAIINERKSGHFVRRFQLPKNAVKDGITASMNNGVLQVTIQLHSVEDGQSHVSIA